jgi:peptidoglycan-associated lipoprotein
MSKKQWFKTFIIVISVVLTSACSKKLLPPEIEMASGTGSMSESSLAEGTDDSAGSVSGGSADSDDSFAAEPKLEKGRGSQPSIFTESAVDANGNAVPGKGFDGTYDSAGGNLSGPDSRTFGTGGDIAQPGDGYYGHYAADGTNTNGFAAKAQDMTAGSGGLGNGGDLPLSDRRDFGSASGENVPDGYTGSFRADGTPMSPSTTDGFASGESHAGSTGSHSGAQVQEGIQEARLLPFKSTANLGDVFFEFDKYGVEGSSMNVLQQNADYLKKRPNVSVEIQGHCDERGTNNYNIALGERRANAIKRKLMSLGVPGSRLHTISYGEEKPFCFESSEACWHDNRRGHFMVSE